MSSEPKLFSRVCTMSAISAGLVMSAGEYIALTPKSFSMPLRSFSIAALSPKPLMVTLAPCSASARAMPRPMPEVEPVTSADFPFSMAIPNSVAKLGAMAPASAELSVSGRNLRRFLLQRNIKSGGAVTFSRSGANPLQWPRATGNDGTAPWNDKPCRARSSPRPITITSAAPARRIAHAEAQCAARAQRLTPIRRQVLETLLASHNPLGAYEIIDRLADKAARPAPITVYRALDFLRDNGLVHRIESRNAFVACVHNHAGDDSWCS